MPRLYRCLRLGLVRAGPSLDTEIVGELAVGAEIIALQETTLPSGVSRVQFDAGEPAGESVSLPPSLPPSPRSLCALTQALSPGWVSRTVSGRGRLARSIPILQDLGELDVLLGEAPRAALSLKEKMTLRCVVSLSLCLTLWVSHSLCAPLNAGSLLASGEVAPEVVESTAEAAAKAELERLAGQGVQGADEALAELRETERAAQRETERVSALGTRVYMSIDEHQAICAQDKVAGDDGEGYEVSDESEDPLGGFDSSDEVCVCVRARARAGVCVCVC